jgi:REP element-mobilizing transposase RayT
VGLINPVKKNFLKIVLHRVYETKRYRIICWKKENPHLATLTSTLPNMQERKKYHANAHRTHTMSFAKYQVTERRFKITQENYIQWLCNRSRSKITLIFMFVFNIYNTAIFNLNFSIM